MEERMKHTDRILEIISNSADPVTLKQIQEQLELNPGTVSGSLVFLCKCGKVCREKIESASGTGPKMQWAYKLVDTVEKIN